MPILTTDIVWKLSTTVGSAGSTTASSGAGTNLGKYMATTAVVNNTLDNVFTDLTGSENTTSQSDYQCVFVHNQNASLTLFNVVVWISVPSSVTTIAIATDNIGPIAYNSSSPQAAAIAFDTAIPVGISSFSSPNSQNNGILLGNIPAQNCAALWIKRTATNSAPVNLDGFTLSLYGDTPM